MDILFFFLRINYYSCSIVAVLILGQVVDVELRCQEEYLL